MHLFDMNDVLIQLVLPFFLSALIVVLITVVAEKFGTKVGGILGTLPSTIIVAYVFIALNKGVDFASNSVSVVPAEMGVNLVFLVLFIYLLYRSLNVALVVGFSFWIVLSSILYLTDLQDIYISFLVYSVSMFATFVLLERVVKIKSVSKRKVHYTTRKILFRGVLTGFIITISVLLSNVGEVLSGIFSIFPAIFTSTMIITYRDHGPDFSAGMAKSMILGSWSVMSYAVAIHFLYPLYGILVGSIVGFLFSLFVTVVIFLLRERIS